MVKEMEQYNPVKVEHEVLAFWKKNKIYEKQKATYKNSKKRWSFIDGPITANNPMGVHHAWGRTLKDIFLRFKAMQRYNIRRQNGFDCQGLWVEVEVEKAKGFKSTKDIEDFGIKKFVLECKERTERMAQKQTEQSIRLGQWMDWDDSYYTHTDKANEYKWMFLKFCKEKGWLYKGVDVVQWCPRCSCTESKHAVATEGYWNETDDALYMKFPVVGRDKEYFLVFTTTAWTVPADVVLSVNPEFYYVRAKKGNEIYILAEKLVEKVLGKNAEILDRFLGSDLEGMAYEMPYADLPAQKDSVISGAKDPEKERGASPHVVVMWSEASEEEGTGIVHNAPGCGPEDYQLGKDERLPAPSPLDEKGIYIEGYGWLTGKTHTEGGKEVIKDMQKRGFMYKTEKYTHSYPHCTRCKTPLVFRLVPEWYIAMDELRPKLIEENKKIKWTPPQGQIYEETWLKNMGDWLISRKRYWGLPLPIWECECGEVTVVGSKAELKKLAVKGFDKMKELHRPWVDEVIIKCPKCKKNVNRVLDTGDVWLDAGMVPFFTLDWLTNKKYFNQWYPADFVTECGPGQYRCWFYSMILHGVALTGKLPFKNVLTDELVKDEKGQEMHKSSGNAIWFDEAADKAGSDPMRWLYSTQDPNKELWFGWNILEEKKKILNVLWNFGNYIQPFLGNKKSTKLTTTDKWLLSKLESMKKKVTDYLEVYQPHLAAVEIENFFLNDLSRGYGQMVRDSIEDPNVVYTTYNAYLELLRLLCPFTPFFVEKIYQELYSKLEKVPSIHLYEWPKYHKELVNKSLEKEMQLAQKLISITLSSREQFSRGIRWPIKSVTVVAKPTILSKLKKQSELIKRLTNTVKLEFALQLKNTTYDVKPDFKKLGPKLGKDVPAFASALAKVSPKELTKQIANGKVEVKVNGKTVSASVDELIIRENLPEGLVGQRDADMAVYIDTHETSEMLSSGFAREIIRKVQDLRKKAGLIKKDRIALTLSLPRDLNINSYLTEIKKKCGVKKLTLGAVKGKKEEFKVRDKSISIGVV